MLLPLELAIGLRYTRAKRRNHFISFISGTSMLGIAIGVWALITVISIMNGFERELRDRILSVASHATISGSSGALAEWDQVSTQIEQSPDVVASAPYIMGQGLITRGGAVTGTLVRGIDPVHEPAVSDVLDKVTAGDIDDLSAGSYGIVLGEDLANQLGARIGDKITVIAPKGRLTPAGLLPRLKRFTLIAVFRLDMYEYDTGLALMHVDDAARLFELDGRVTGLRLKLADVYQAPRVRKELASLLGPGYYVGDWTREHANFFRALKIEKRVMFIILSLIVAVAAFNIVSTLVMVVTDKQADVAILRTLGMNRRSIMIVFIVQGVIIGAVGIVFGGVSGVLTALNVETIIPAVERLLNTEFFPSSVYVISDFPAEMRWSDVTKILSAAFVMSLLSTIYPAWRASRVQPSEALRYE